MPTPASLAPPNPTMRSEPSAWEMMRRQAIQAQEPFQGLSKDSPLLQAMAQYSSPERLESNSSLAEQGGTQGASIDDWAKKLGNVVPLFANQEQALLKRILSGQRLKDIQASGYDDLLSKIGARFDFDPYKPIDPDALKDTQFQGILRKLAQPEFFSEPYVGSSSMHPSYAPQLKKFGADIEFNNQMMLQFPSRTAPQYIEENTIGKGVPLGNGPDPFIWADQKWQNTKGLLQAIKDEGANNPLNMHTRSDLPATQDYMDLLNPDLHKVSMHIPTIDRDMSFSVEPGSPSAKRRFRALAALKDAGIPINLTQDILVSPNGDPLTELLPTRRGLLQAMEEQGLRGTALNSSKYDYAENNIPLNKTGWEGLLKSLNPELSSKIKKKYEK